MPFVKVFTNLATNQLPKAFMPKFNKELAAILNKDEAVFKWQLETDKCMAVVSASAQTSLRGHTYVTSANFLDFWTPSSRLVHIWY